MSLNVAYDTNNIFAKIIRGKIPSTKLYETSDILAFMDVFPQSDGHCLVIHKHTTAVNLFDVDPDKLSTLIIAVQKVAGAVKDGLTPDGIRIVQFNGAPAGQSVFHLHFHIIPVYAGCELGAHACGEPADISDLEILAEKIRAAL
jgi:histidine triad (HIT) family protein